ncbi:hypothetical protein Adt_27147 [Abeliophyllum distichum]|uniref:Retrotransposon Copia-like N-terminal domain-containing protein n=1 Tax=Abeliophyllum distichum TaxID=126358 RepID=A0ABD1RU24_9LAMI
MANYNSSNQSQNSDSNSMAKAPVHVSNLAPLGMNLTQAAYVKLDIDNFLFWKNVIMPNVRGHGLEGRISTGNQGMSSIIHQISSQAETGTTVEMSCNLEHSR